MNWTDWAIILILVVSSLISLRRGLVKEALSLVVWVVAFLVATWFSPKLALYFSVYAGAPSAAFAVLFIVTLLLGSGLSYLLSSLVKAVGLSTLDRMLGVIFGCARGILIVLMMVLYMPIVLSTLDQEPWWQQSTLIPYFLRMETGFHQLTSALSDVIANII